MSGFVIASKQMAKAKIALMGPSGSGKTYSALRLARGLTSNGRVGVLDSENNSASLYADKFSGWQYLVLPISPPYTARKYLDAIELALREKLDCLIIDSLTHVWAGEGGLLQQKEALDSRSGSNSYTNWNQITKVHEAIKSKILYSPIHMITTMRSKQEYVMEQNDRGKSVPKKVGLKPIQRDDLEYEFTVVFDIGMDHQFMVSKDRTDLFDGMVATVTEQTGMDIRSWLCNEIQTPDVGETEQLKEPAELIQVREANAKAESAAEALLITSDMQNAHGGVSVSKIVAASEKREQARKIINHADGSVREVVAAPNDPAQYVVKCGANWGMVGKKIIEINESTLKAALAQAEGLITKGNKDPNVMEFIRNVRSFLGSVGVAI